MVYYCVTRVQCVTTLRPWQNGHHFADDTFKCIFLNETVKILIKISPKFAPIGLINNIPAFSAADLALAVFSLTNALSENMPSRYYNVFNLCLCNAATIRYSLLKLGHMHLCGIDYKYFSPHSCKCNNLGCTAAIKCGSACHGPHSDNVSAGS